ncbi:MAG: hypothetical protein WCA56_03695, partial [Xanthobacteraceae bacterium]
MTNNVVDLAAHRRESSPDEADARAQRNADRASEAAELLEQLRHVPRIPTEDRPVLARNLGRLIERLAPQDQLSVTKMVLDSSWSKRMRYVRFGNETTEPPPDYAASGPAFAGIIDRLSAEKESKGFSKPQALMETVFEALRGTSYHRPSRFKVKESLGDGAFLVTHLAKVCGALAEQVELDEYFETISKYPIYPMDYDSPNRKTGRLLDLVSKREPNRLHSWDTFLDDDELQTWLPWWAPKCVLGHLYVRFVCKSLSVPEQCVSEIKRSCDGKVDKDAWDSEECSWEIEPAVQAETTHPRTVFHRLPVWLVVLPSTGGLVPCLYASVHHWDEFQIEQSVKNETYFDYYSYITACFVEEIGATVQEDVTYFLDNDDDHEPTYICAHGDAINVIGCRVGTDVENFRSDLLTAWDVHDLPEWLQEHPVQRLLRLTVDSPSGSDFALTPRVFPKDFGYRRVT